VDAFQQFASKERQRRFEVRQGRSDELPVDSATVDLVVSRESLHEWKDIRAGCAETCRVLKPGGFVALEDLNRASPRWKRTLFVLLTGMGTGLEITRTRLRAFQDAFTLKEIEGLLTDSGFVILHRKGGLSWYVVAEKKEGAPRGL
jgi:ubiquinone/menaquinone biosynthesis C-methylase UbiE